MKFSTFLYNVVARAETNFHDEIRKIRATTWWLCSRDKLAANEAEEGRLRTISECHGG
jgi:hypothetical protein